MMSDLHFQSAARNREKIRSLLPNALIVLEGNRSILRNKGHHYPFRQSSDFLYLSGVEEPGCLLIISPDEDQLFLPLPEKKNVIWQGDPDPPEIIKQKTNFSGVDYHHRFDKTIARLSKKYSHCYCDKSLQKRLKKISPDIHFYSFRMQHALTSLRMEKNSHEIEMLKIASNISSCAHKEVMKQCHAGLYEYQILGIFLKALYDHHITDTAFPTIAASGPNASILHYCHNQKKLSKGELLLLDAGGEFHGYAADISRTFPVSGCFSSRQKVIYEIVLEAQRRCIEKIRGGVLLTEIQDQAITTLVEGLKELKILVGSPDEIREKKSHSIFFPHGVSHVMGLDVHDVYLPMKKKRGQKSTLLRANILIKPNYVITVEPGLYFIKSLLTDKSLQRKHRDTIHWPNALKYLDFGGVRIEDDVVVTDQGCWNLTDVPKTIEDIETWMKG
jgi:Xaa-Pro dipeptidase